MKFYIPAAIHIWEKGVHGLGFTKMESMHLKVGQG